MMVQFAAIKIIVAAVHLANLLPVMGYFTVMTINSGKIGPVCNFTNSQGEFGYRRIVPILNVHPPCAVTHPQWIGENGEFLAESFTQIPVFTQQVARIRG